MIAVDIQQTHTRCPCWFFILFNRERDASSVVTRLRHKTLRTSQCCKGSRRCHAMPRNAFVLWIRQVRHTCARQQPSRYIEREKKNERQIKEGDREKRKWKRNKKQKRREGNTPKNVANSKIPTKGGKTKHETPPIILSFEARWIRNEVVPPRRCERQNKTTNIRKQANKQTNAEGTMVHLERQDKLDIFHTAASLKRMKRKAQMNTSFKSHSKQPHAAVCGTSNMDRHVVPMYCS